MGEIGREGGERKREREREREGERERKRESKGDREGRTGRQGTMCAGRGGLVVGFVGFGVCVWGVQIGGRLSVGRSMISSRSMNPKPANNLF